jgi:hypothetical protein
MAKVSNFNVSIKPEEVMYTSINTSKDGYNSARMVMKSGDKAYMSIGFEWEGGGIPDFVLEMMAFMKSSGVETSGVWEGKEAAFSEWAAKTDPKMAEKEICKGCGKKKDKCECK